MSRDVGREKNDCWLTSYKLSANDLVLFNDRYGYSETPLNYCDTIQARLNP